MQNQRETPDQLNENLNTFCDASSALHFYFKGST